MGLRKNVREEIAASLQRKRLQLQGELRHGSISTYMDKVTFNMQKGLREEGGEREEHRWFQDQVKYIFSITSGRNV